jgi:hypothetical protein
MSDRRNHPRQGTTYAKAAKAVRALGGDPSTFRRRMGRRHTYTVAAVVRMAEGK